MQPDDDARHHDGGDAMLMLRFSSQLDAAQIVCLFPTPLAHQSFFTSSYIKSLDAQDDRLLRNNPLIHPQMPVTVTDRGGLELGWKNNNTIFVGPDARRHGIYFDYNRSSLLPLISKVRQRHLMVEVGSLAGFSTRVFARYFDRVVSVDAYSPGYDAADINSRPTRLNIARDLFTLRFFDEPRVTQLRLNSSAAASRFEDASLDLVYVDAGHSYGAVHRDIQCWRAKVKPGGVIAGDDYWWGNAREGGVRQAVIELLGSHEVIAGRWMHIVTAAPASTAATCVDGRQGRRPEGMCRRGHCQLSLQRCMSPLCTSCTHCSARAYELEGSPHLLSWSSTS